MCGRPVGVLESLKCRFEDHFFFEPECVDAAEVFGFDVSDFTEPRLGFVGRLAIEVCLSILQVSRQFTACFFDFLRRAGLALNPQAPMR